MERCINIIVLYDNEKEVEDYIYNAEVHSEHLTDYILVINKDTTHAADRLKEKFENRICIKDFHDNVGYLNALLLSLDSIELDDYKYIILSNTDIEYTTERFFRKLLEKQYSDDIGCIAPDVYSSLTKTHSNPHYMEKLSKNRLARTAFIFSHPALVPLYMKLAEFKARNNKTQKQNSCYVYSPHGCYMILTSEFAKRIKGKRYPVKMYCEEGWIAGNLRNMGLKCYYDDSISVVHNEHSTTGRMGFKNQARLFSEALKNEIVTFYD